MSCPAPMLLLTFLALGVPAAAAAADGIPVAPQVQVPAAPIIRRADQGFSLAVPAGWQQYSDPNVAAAIVLTTNPSVAVVVHVVPEDAPSDVNEVLASSLVALFEGTQRRVSSQRFDVFQGRAAVFAELEDATTRIKVLIVAKDEGARSQVFYTVLATAPRSSFDSLAAMLDRAIRGFQFLAGPSPPAPVPPAAAHARPSAETAPPVPAPPPVSTPAPVRAQPSAPAPVTPTPPVAPPPVAPPPVAPAPRQPPPAQAQAAPPPARVPAGPADVGAASVDRARVFDRVLGPRPASEAAAATQTASPANALDGAAAYDRALVFFQQGAWAEAEKEFRNAEKKDDRNLEFVFSEAYAKLKLHQPDEAIKRYDKIYKKDPANLRAIVGMAASYEEMQHYGNAVRIWQRYVRSGVSGAAKQEGQALLRWAQDMFVERYEIAENPGGGAVNALTREQELQVGQAAAGEFARSGVEPLRDETVTTYVMNLCAYLVANAKNFPSNYQVFVIDTADVNAFTIPGFVFVYRGLLAAVDSESELAGVIAHEIGHVVAHHSAKKLTKQVMDQQQAEQWRNSNSKFLRWLGSTSASGAAYSQAAFSREAEEQADRLAVHITFDSGIDPRGFAAFFQKLESIDPSSRKAWDLMQRSHPFSIDRLNTINAYIDLLPDRPRRTSSPDFARMKSRLATLPPPTDATGLQRPALEPGRAEPTTQAGVTPEAAGVATQPFTMDAVPFGGEIPAGWTGRKTPSGTIIFEGPKGTEAYEVSVELGLEPKRAGLSIDQVAGMVNDALAQKPQARVDATSSDTASDGTPVRIVRASYSLQAPSGTLVPLKHLTVILDYPGYYAILSYFTPEGIYQKYSDAFTLIMQRFRYTGR